MAWTRDSRIAIVRLLRRGGLRLAYAVATRRSRTIDAVAPPERIRSPVDGVADHATAVRPRLILVVVALVVGACSGPAGSSPATSPASSGAGQPSPSSEPSPAASKAAVVVGGDRPVTVHVPASYDAAKPAPLLVVLHGYGSSGSEHESYFHLEDAAQERGFLTAYPDGTKDADGNRFWSATDACCDFDRTGVNDVAYLAGVITEIQSKLAVDPKRIYLVGHSNGGFMSYRMACVHADVIAAIASLAGATFANPADCARRRRSASSRSTAPRTT
jgi:polyhydroxybutyrate depolymerase